MREGIEGTDGAPAQRRLEGALPKHLEAVFLVQLGVAADLLEHLEETGQPFPLEAVRKKLQKEQAARRGNRG